MARWGSDAVRITFIVVISILCLTIVILAYFLFDRRTEMVAPTPAPLPLQTTAVTSDERVEVSGNNSRVVGTVKAAGEHVVLPDGQVTVSTIIDVEALRKENPIFYRYAKNDDKVLTYPGRAILYDPVTDRIVAIWDDPDDNRSP